MTRSKGYSVIDAIGSEIRRPYAPEDILRAAHDVEVKGGSWTTADVIRFLKWAASIITPQDVRQTVNAMVREQVTTFREQMREAFLERDRAIDTAEHEYERAREEFGERAEKAEAENERLNNELADYENLKAFVPECVLYAVWGLFGRISEKQLGYQETRELAEYIENYGTGTDSYGMAI